MSDQLIEKRHAVEAILQQLGHVLIAFSGGVDSTLLAKLARDALGKERAVAVTADSPSLAREDLAEAQRLARVLDLDHLVIATRELEDPAYRHNSPARCYACKRELFEELEVLAQARAIPAVLYGAITDDMREVRPGHRAATERGVRAPLQEAGFEKWEVRELAKQLSLPNWDRPQNACLSSRIPHGLEVTEEKLSQVERAEALLRAQGFYQVRVRHLGAHARIEVGAEEVARFNQPALCLDIAQAFSQLGFETVGVDRRGYRAGGADRPDVDEVSLTSIATC